MADGSFNLSDILHENWMLEEGCSLQPEHGKFNEESVNSDNGLNGNFESKLNPRKNVDEMLDHYSIGDEANIDKRIFMTPDLTQNQNANPPMGNSSITDLYAKNDESNMKQEKKVNPISFSPPVGYPYVPQIPTQASILKAMRTTKKPRKELPQMNMFQQQMHIAYINQINMGGPSAFDYTVPMPQRMIQRPVERIVNPQVMYSAPLNSANYGSHSTYNQQDRSTPFKSDFELPTNLLDGDFEKPNDDNCEFQKSSTEPPPNNGSADIARGDYSRTEQQQPHEHDDECVIDKSKGFGVGDNVSGEDDDDDDHNEKDGEQDDVVVLESGEHEVDEIAGRRMINASDADIGRTTRVEAKSNGLEESGNVGGVEQEGIEKPAGVAGSTEDNGVESGCDDGKSMRNCSKSELEELLNQPIRHKLSGKSAEETAVKFGNMQFYQPSPAQHHVPRATPPPNFAQPYGMNMQEETRQIMNLDNQQTHNSSPTSSWNSHQQYAQMSTMGSFPPRGPPMYPAPPMQHHNAPPPPPTSNPYYQPPSHMAPSSMMPPGIHAQAAQQPYFNAQSPMTGTPPSMSYGTPGMVPQATNANVPVFSFSKPRHENGNGSSNGSSSANRRKKHPMNDMGSPRYGDDTDATVFPDMSDFPLLDVVQSKAKKDAGRKPCRPHLCEQSRMLISRVCHYHREFAKRLPPRHPLAGSMLSKPDQWTSQIMGVSLATVRKCVDMATEEEVFTRCTDKNLVNLTPAERTEREELLAKLSTVFEDEKSLGAGTAGLTIAEYSPRRSYSGVFRQQSSVDGEKSSLASNGNDGETTWLNLDEHSNNSKDLSPPASLAEVNGANGASHEMGALIDVPRNGSETVQPAVPKEGVKNRGRPKKSQTTPSAAQPNKVAKRKMSSEGSENADDKDEMEKKTEDENESALENEKKDSNENEVPNEIEREDDAASSEGTNRSETATPEPAAATTNAPPKGRRGKKKKKSTADNDDYVSAKRKKNAPQNDADEDSAEHRMVTRARSRQP